MGKLYLIRHGETDYNRFRRYCGSSDVSLNKRGKLQAKSLSRLLKNEKFDVIFSSPLKRAIETSKIMADGRRVIVEPALREIDFGLWEGFRFEQIRRRFDKEISLWLKRPITTRVPEGESYGELQKRVIGFFNKVISDMSGKTIAFVTHHGPIKAIILETLRLDERDFWNISIEPGCVIAVTVTP